jgi:hypothetical protein
MKLPSITLILPILLLSCSRSCDNPLGLPVAYKLHVLNNSPSSVYYLISKVYPDTSIRDSFQLGGLAPSKQQPYESRKTWPKFFEALPRDTLSIFFFSPDTVHKYDWKKVQGKYLILKRKDISLTDLEASDYTVTYP